MNKAMQSLGSLLLLLCVSALDPLVLMAKPPDDVSPNRWVEVRSTHFVVSSNAGEQEAREIAEQFEQVRAMFHSVFTTLRVDPPQPMAILAARDEATMRMLAPDEWEGEGRSHPAGLFHSDGDKDYVVLRLDAKGTNAFHTIYHEYTHALLHLNFTRIPTWLNEGLAEFFGNSTLTEKDAKTGTMDTTHLYILSKNDLLPMETLLEVTESSPYYNEKNRASIFYAQSWAVVHYLLLDREARRQQLLSKFLVAWSRSGNQIAAAREAFGDLPRFEETIKRYVRKPDFRLGVSLPPQDIKASEGAARNLSAGEVLAIRGEFLVRRKQLWRAQPLLEEAVQTEPSLPVAHEALGFFHFRNGDFAEADEEMTKAIELGSTSFIPFYCHGVLLLRDLAGTQELTRKATALLEQAAALNPQFAPTFEALAQGYSRSDETLKQALQAAQKTVLLDPESNSYQILLAYVLLNNNRPSDARAVVQKLLARASSVEETQTARAVLRRVEEEEEWFKESQTDAASDGNVTGATAGGAPQARPAEAARRLGPPESVGVDGFISTVDCSHRPEIVVTLGLLNGPMSFHITDAHHVAVSGVSALATPELESCGELVGRRVKLWVRLVQGKEYLGEISKIYFY